MLKLVPVFHESTHIGDEYAIYDYHNVPGFKIINVFYEAWQIFAGLNRPENTEQKSLSAEIGFQRLMRYKEGYYSIDSLEVQGADIVASEARSLFIIRINFQSSANSKKRKPKQFVASAENRMKPNLAILPKIPRRKHGLLTD